MPAKPLALRYRRRLWQTLRQTEHVISCGGTAMYHGLTNDQVDRIFRNGNTLNDFRRLVRRVRVPENFRPVR